MASLKELRRRIHSVENIRQITRSMEMVAAARLQKALQKAAGSRDYVALLRGIAADFIAVTDEKEHPLLRRGGDGPMALVVAGADRGLCGSYNTALFNYVDRYLKEHASEKIELILIGRKVVEYYGRKKVTIGKTIPEWGGKIAARAIDELYDELQKMFLSGKYASMRLCYTQYQTVFLRNIVDIPLLPVEPSLQKDAKEARDVIIEPNSEELSEELFKRLCLAEVFNMLHQAYASELAARVCAMRSATKNAEEMIERLTLERNKVRQANITKEMLEISTGAEAMKG